APSEGREVVVCEEQELAFGVRDEHLAAYLTVLEGHREARRELLAELHERRRHAALRTVRPRARLPISPATRRSRSGWAAVTRSPRCAGSSERSMADA